MSDFGTMQSNIATLLRRDDLTAEIKLAINRAIAHYSTENWPWFETRSTSLTTTASTKTVAVPSDFVYDLSMHVTVNNAKYPVSKRTMQYVEELYYSDSLEEQPFIYAHFANAFYLYPIPDNTYTLTLLYYAKPAVLTNSTDSNDWTTTAEELIEARAMWWLATAVMRNDQVAASNKGREMDAYSRIRSQATMQASSGKLRPSTRF